MSIRVLDIFCGCGGISWGLHKAGFEIIAGIDNDKIALQTFQLNHPKALISYKDLAKTDPETWLSEVGLGVSDIDCIVGGPPCQGFSKNVPRSQRFLDDDRNLLVKRFLSFVSMIRPKIVIMENVGEIVNAFDGQFQQEILSFLDSLGYYVKVKVLNSADYGIPQERRRAFFLGSLLGEIDFPESSHSKASHKISFNTLVRQKHVSVWDAFGDLPSLSHGEGDDPTVYSVAPFTPYQVAMRNGAEHLHNHVARKLNPTQFKRLASIQPGEGAKDLPAELRPKSHYSGAYGRLSKEMVAKTLTRWMFHPGSGRYGHPVDVRTITIREAARLQSFSDDFIFTGSFTQASSQIGNSVPPLLMHSFARVIHQHLLNSSST
jgi:DNA (cytosine-5)-methyltransferase 1